MQFPQINLSKKSPNWNIIQFPDGQQDIIINAEKYLNSEAVVITSRFNSFKDLELILCATAALRRVKVKNIILDMPYLLGGRSDRVFSAGGTSYLRDVVSPIINSQKYSEVWVYDVHNVAVADACINNLYVRSNASLVGKVLNDIGDCEIIAPDEGAGKKIYKLLEDIGWDKTPIVCSKKRNSEGAIIDTQIGGVVSFQGKKAVIVDDICDGGRTFIEIAKKVLLLDCPEVHLVVSHGIFSNGFGELSKYIKHIHCTNSISDITNPIVTQYPI